MSTSTDRTADELRELASRMYRAAVERQRRTVRRGEDARRAHDALVERCDELERALNTTRNNFLDAMDRLRAAESAAADADGERRFCDRNCVAWSKRARRAETQLALAMTWGAELAKQLDECRDLRDRATRAEIERDAAHERARKAEASLSSVRFQLSCNIGTFMGETVEDMAERACEAIASKARVIDAINAELDAATKRAEAAEAVHWRPVGTDAAFAPPFGTIRACRACGCLVAGGPTACARCAEGA